ncbi:MAG: NAD(P)-binding protein [Leptospira sp.]|nr:NAD(P)-binding protein [Leptospira sp.]
MRIHIIGGGITGLFLAYRELKKGNQVTLYEESTRLGGIISTKQVPEGIVETAANGFLCTDALKALCSDIGIQLIPANSHSRRRYFWRDKKVKRVPLTFFEILRLFYGIFFKKLKIKSTGNFWEWSKDQFGFFASKFIIEPAIGGIYGSRLFQLDPKVVFPYWDFNGNTTVLQNLKLKKSKSLGTHSFCLGMGSFIDSMGQYLQNHIEIQYETKVKSMEELHSRTLDGDIYLAIPVQKVINFLDKDMTKNFNIDMISLTSITRFSKERITKKPCFGILFPEGEGINALGVLSNSDIFPNRVDKSINRNNETSSETWIYQNYKNPVGSEESWKEIIERDRKIVNPKSTDPLAIYITTWNAPFPVYNSELESLNQFLDGLEQKSNSTHQKIRFFGNYRRNLGIRSIFESTLI